jgi:outer membrane protein
MKRYLLTVLSVFWAACGIRAQDSLTIEQVVRRVASSNPAVAQALWNRAAAGERASQAESARFPAVSAEAQYANIGPVPELTIPMMGTFKFYPENNYDVHVAARYTVFDFGRTGATVDLGRSRVESADETVLLVKEGLALQAVRTFYAVLFLKKSCRVQDEQIDALNRHIEGTRKRVEAGAATDFDVLTTRVRVAAAQARKVDVETALRKQEALLRQLMNVPADAPLLIKGDFEPRLDSLNEDSLIKTAFSRRTELALARAAERSARLQIKLSRLGHLPSFDLNLSYGSKNGYIPNLNEMRANWVAGIRAEMPLFEGGRILHRTEEAKATLAAEEAHTKDVERQVLTDLEQTLADVQAARANVEIARVQLDQAHEAVDMARTRYETGAVTNLDLLDAETVEAESKLTSLQALYRCVVSQYELDRAVGNKIYGEDSSPQPNPQ